MGLKLFCSSFFFLSVFGISKSVLGTLKIKSVLGALKIIFLTLNLNKICLLTQFINLTASVASPFLHC
jgi:hypothetical protein